MAARPKPDRLFSGIHSASAISATTGGPTVTQPMSLLQISKIWSKSAPTDYHIRLADTDAVKVVTTDDSHSMS